MGWRDGIRGYAWEEAKGRGQVCMQDKYVLPVPFCGGTSRSSVFIFPIARASNISGKTP